MTRLERLFNDLLQMCRSKPDEAAKLVGKMKAAGAEPDESWCIGEEKEFPDVVLEIALTSGGVKKLKIYRQFHVPEVWFWRRNKLEIFALDTSGNYERSKKSRVLPDLDIALIERCVAIHSWQEARQSFRAGLSKSK